MNDNVTKIDAEISRLINSQPQCFMNFGIGPEINPYLINMLENGWHGIFVEPHPFHILNAFKELAPFSDRVHVFQGVIYDSQSQHVKAGCIQFNNILYPEESGASGILPWRNHETEAFTCNVPVLDLGEIISNSKVPVNFLDVDCENAEHAIFHAYDFNLKPKDIKLSIHSSLNAQLKLVDHFRKNGYNLKIDADDKKRGEHYWFSIP